MVTHLIGYDAAISDPALASVGGSVNETFHFPADPELLIQRTDNACQVNTGLPYSAL
jgi:hypothetical protein